MATGTLLERVGRAVGVRPALGEWDRDQAYQALLAKLTELRSRREHIAAGRSSSRVGHVDFFAMPMPMR